MKSAPVFPVILFFALGSVWSPALRAEDSPLNAVQEASKALVSIQAVNATVMRARPQGVLDKATGSLLVVQKVRPVGYSRTGSGVIIDPRGIVVTTAHTVRNAGGMSVKLFDGTSAKVRSVDIVPGSDLAFIAIIPPFDLTAVPFVDSDQARKGDAVYTIGHSQWLNGTMLGGKISSIKREKTGGVQHATVIQVTFPMRQGDSGCPILDRRGQFLGLVNAGRARGSATFAVASNLVSTAFQTYLKKRYPDIGPGVAG